REQDRRHQGGPRDHRPRPQGSEGPRRGRSQDRQGRRLEGLVRRVQEEAGGPRREGRAQVGSRHTETLLTGEITRVLPIAWPRGMARVTPVAPSFVGLVPPGLPGRLSWACPGWGARGELPAPLERDGHGTCRAVSMAESFA